MHCTSVVRGLACGSRKLVVAKRTRRVLQRLLFLALALPERDSMDCVCGHLSAFYEFQRMNHSEAGAIFG